MELIAVVACLCSVAVAASSAMTAWMAWKVVCVSQKSDTQFHVEHSAKKNPVPISLDILSNNAESENENAVQFDAEEALSEMNEWERSLCSKQQAAWEILNPGVAWKLTPSIYRQIRRAALRRI